jgi:hypothetical protein
LVAATITGPKPYAMWEIVLSRHLREMKEDLRQKTEKLQELEKANQTLQKELFLLIELYADMQKKKERRDLIRST